MINETFDPVAAGQQAQRLKDAAAEPSFSGALRRAVHASRLPVRQIAADSSIPVHMLCDWLEGNAVMMSSDVDRLVKALHLERVQIS